MKTAIITAVLALAVAPAFAATWERVNDDKNDQEAYVDTSSIRSMGDTAQAWSKVVVKHPKPGSFATVVQLQAYSCSAHSASLMSLTSYKADGSLLRTWKADAPDFTDAVPDTVGDVLVTYVCSHRK